jgi:uncharacterized protein with FMN-binding domain
VSDGLPPYPTPPQPPPDPDRRERPASLARRVVPAVAILGAAGGLLVLLDHPGGGEAAAGTGPDTALAPGATSTPSTAASPTTVPSGGGSSSRSTTTTVPATPTCTGTTVTGDSVTTRYGPVQVQITVDPSGKVCAADAVASPNGDRKSQSINARAVPQLDQKAVAAGSASFNGVSGATITSNAYKKSLQSALDKA